MSFFFLWEKSKINEVFADLAKKLSLVKLAESKKLLRSKQSNQIQTLRDYFWKLSGIPYYYKFPPKENCFNRYIDVPTFFFKNVVVLDFLKKDYWFYLAYIIHQKMCRKRTRASDWSTVICNRPDNEKNISDVIPYKLMIKPNNP